MRKARVARWLGGGFLAVLVLGFVVWTWVIPSLIVGRIGANYGGRVTIRSWWLNSRSAGVSGLALHEDFDNSSSPWLNIPRVETDLTLGGLLRGRTTPTVVTIVRPNAQILLDKNGKLATQIPLKSSGGKAAPLPTIKLVDATVHIRRTGRSDTMTIAPIGALAKPQGDQIEINARVEDSTWGTWTASGRFKADGSSGSVTLANPTFHANSQKLAQFPFVPENLGDHVRPLGTIGVEVLVEVDRSKSEAVRPETRLTLEGTRLELPTLGLIATRSTGSMALRDGVMRLQSVTGDALGGQITANGTLDFRAPISRFDIILNLQGIDVAGTPPKWELEKLGVTGRLRGDAHLKVAAGPERTDLTGTTGEAVVENATLQGIPIKSLKLNLKAQGQNLRYDSVAPKTASLTSLMIALQAPSKPKTTDGPVLKLPKSISTQIELEDVELSQILAKGQAFGIPIVLPIAGKLSLKADATIPLRKLSSLRNYRFHGEAVLKEASIAGVDLGRVDATLDLKEGSLALTDFRGQFVERPAGSFRKPPPPTPPVPVVGPLPSGAFRGSVRAELAPKGPITATFSGHELPITELAAPFAPRPTPVSGRINLELHAKGAVDALRDAKAWNANGTIQGNDVRAHGATITDIRTTFNLDAGTLHLPELSAKLEGKPLDLSGTVALSAPQAFQVRLNVAGWSLAEAFAFVPGVPRPAPVSGALTADVEASGTLNPLVTKLDGGGSITAFQVGLVPLGTLPFQFKTVEDSIHVSIDDARPFGGKISAAATIPTRPGPRAVGSLQLENVGLGHMSKAIPNDEWLLTGKATGHLDFSAATHSVPDVSPFDANLTLSAPDLIVRGIEAKHLRAVVTARQGFLHYDVFTESLGGTVKFKGDYPLSAKPAKAETLANLQAVGFSIAGLGKGLGVSGVAARLDGTAAVDVNILARPPSLAPRAAGRIEVRDLRIGKEFPIGQFKGILHYAPNAWRLDPIRGTFLGGPASGQVWSEDNGPERAINFGMDLDNASLSSALAFIPFVSKRVDGNGALRISGRLSTTLRVELQALVSHARVFGLPLDELRAPAELTYNANGNTGSLIVRDATARFGGGQLRMRSRFQFGDDPRYQAHLQLTKLDLEGATRAASDAQRTASGRISGDIELNGPNPDDIKRMKGRINLDLSDASIVELPVFREIDRFLGASRGGLFEQGNLSGQIANRQLLVDQLALRGRLVQIHANGTIGFDEQLNLEVLINTNQLIPETGQALVRLIPGLGTSTRRDQALQQVSGFLSNRLTKVRVSGTLRNPQVTADPAIVVTQGAAAFFVGVLELPLGLVR